MLKAKVFEKYVNGMASDVMVIVLNFKKTCELVITIFMPINGSEEYRRESGISAITRSLLMCSG
jgi:hypothetical protein